MKGIVGWVPLGRIDWMKVGYCLKRKRKRKGLYTAPTEDKR
jgi:hypothetical protein